MTVSVASKGQFLSASDVGVKVGGLLGVPGNGGLNLGSVAPVGQDGQRQLSCGRI